MKIKEYSNKLVLLILLLLTGVVSSAQESFFKKLEKESVASTNTVVWESMSAGNSGFANLLRYHPTIPKLVAFCPDMWNAYQTENNGTSWYGTTDPDGDGSFYHLRDLGYSVSEPTFALALGRSELWQSTDTGKTWKVVPNCPWYKVDTDGSDLEGWKPKMATLAIDPTDKNVWYAAGGANVKRQMWVSSFQKSTAATPHGNSALLEGKLWRTKNGGKSWYLSNKGIHPKAQVGNIIVNPTNSKQVFAASNYGLYRSDNGGKSWKHISKGKLENDIIRDMDFYYNAKTGQFILYLIDQVHYQPMGKTTTCTGGIFYSEDEGVTWRKMNGDLGLDINQLSGGVPQNYYKYIAKWFGISSSKAKKLYPELPKNAVQSFNMICADPSREGALYIGFADPQKSYSILPGRVWTTDNYGRKWTNTARMYTDAWEKDKQYWKSRNNPTHQNMTVGHYSPHMRFGTDYALRSLRAMDVGVDGSVMMVSDHSTMLSTDHGKSWHQVDEDTTPSGAIVGRGNSNLPALHIAQDKRFKSTLLGSSENYLWIPTGEKLNGTQALQFVNSTQSSVNCIAFDPYDAKTVYSTSSRQEEKQYMYKSKDGGQNWKEYSVATPATKKWFDDFYTNGLTIDPINNQYMYYGITQIVNAKRGLEGGFFVSKDYGKTFQQSNAGLPSPSRINDIEFDPRDETRASLFAAAQHSQSGYFKEAPNTKEGGLYHSTNRGTTWTKINTPKKVKGVHFITIDHTNRMYISTGYRKAKTGGVWYTDDFGYSWNQIFTYPEVECVEVSPFDHNLIAVTVKFTAKNPGVFISRDRGKTWTKNNKNIGIPHQIEDIKFDIHNAGELWLASRGCGFYKGKIENGDKVQVVKVSQDVVESKDRKKVQLSAKIINSDYYGQKIVWKSENPGIAKVNKKGEVTPVSKGQTKIWATTKDGRFSDFSVITVFP
ncbi:photosystem II stability/assembly factor-like uncharacterized protein [Wenyingzhuangia heitensis]|uniref:Photosystem II stability/assembly factor-like uncharacterized protein n=1 Tax=Wenyingzhuangia heitensis TaxID=1487859 RepID=A0ABX0U869_9FLAO|nr:Ig-like domain-containing protein [Wenyingzhuangia heitensis]NIJ44948.1 photosystem II stability/assembly factor-like uncharacterized protein [Wenyingzhuangia heitensis]